jgi:hypothetical protein
MIRHRLNDALKDALRTQDHAAIITLRLILTAIRDRDLAARARGNTEGVSDREILDLLRTMIRQRRESISLYEQGGRLDLVESEEAEIDVIKRFLPKQLDEGETRGAVRQVIDDLGAAGLKDVGRTMTELRTRYPGQMDFAKASGMVKKELG